jgi:predicted molibdopterin-dependent oxidoreductase YjgC
LRIKNHPILGPIENKNKVKISIDGKAYEAFESEMIAAVMTANRLMVHRYTSKRHEPRGVFCGIGQCSDCVMIVDGKPNVRTCITPVEEGMRIETQRGHGKLAKK